MVSAPGAEMPVRRRTVLAVDHGGLRTWLIDDKAMVQPMGMRAWRPLREVLAEESAAVTLPLVPPPPPRSRTIAAEVG